MYSSSLGTRLEIQLKKSHISRYIDQCICCCSYKMKFDSRNTIDTDDNNGELDCNVLMLLMNF